MSYRTGQRRATRLGALAIRNQLPIVEAIDSGGYLVYLDSAASSQKPEAALSGIGRVHPHDVATILDGENIAVRAGHHCTQPLHHELGINASVRASSYIYNTLDDVDSLIAGLERVRKIFDLETQA